MTGYVYSDENGAPLFRVIRRPGKRFHQERLNDQGRWVKGADGVRRVPYRLPEVLAAIERGDSLVYVVEGEKDADRLVALGLVATTNPMGAGKWRDEYAHYFAGADVVVIADRDKPGIAHARKVATSLRPVASAVALRVPPDGVNDVSDLLDSALDLSTLEPLPEADEAPAESYSLTRFSSVEPRAVRWAWRDRIALAKLTALSGRPKIGKGLLYSHLIAQVTRGDIDGDLTGPRNVILVTSEDAPEDTLVPRLIAAGADTARVTQFTMGTRSEPTPFRVPQDVVALRQAVEEEDAALVVIDPLMEYLDGKVDSHKSHPVRRAVAALNGVGRDTGCAIVVLIHLNKGAQPRADRPGAVLPHRHRARARQ
jgi:putative DNA primase/helicase